EGAGGGQRPARGYRAGTGRRLLYGSPPESQKTRHSIKCRHNQASVQHVDYAGPKLFYISMT
ncbi:hypothetical protein ACQKI4_16070, partial [Paenibacillus glucanolyticus]|uniref:hypothetical protein n=1 Tax=Paenibacillus glucanolyticus TaxID=59843 RepID=UPI003CFDC154